MAWGFAGSITLERTLSVMEEILTPTATLSELFILNEAHRKREEIWSCVDYIYIAIA